MPRNKKEHVLARRARVAELYLRGIGQVEIAKREGVTQPQISQDLKLICQAWQRESIMAMGEIKAKELAKIDLLEREAWDAWERSKLPQRRRSMTKGGAAGNIENLAEIESPGNPRFLEQIERCIKARCQLLKLVDANVAVNILNVQPKDWV